MIGVLGAVIMVTGSLLVVPSFGGEGAAAVRFFVFLIMAVLMMRGMQFEGSLSRMYRTVGKVAAAALLCGLAAYAVLHLIGGVLGLIVSIACGALVYFIALRLLAAIPVEDPRADRGSDRAPSGARCSCRRPATRISACETCIVRRGDS